MFELYFNPRTPILTFFTLCHGPMRGAWHNGPPAYATVSVCFGPGLGFKQFFGFGPKLVVPF